jgi:hypothetical protein
MVDMAIALVTTDRTQGSKATLSIIVEKEMPGFLRGKKENLMGVRGLETGELIFDNCRVPRENVLGEMGQGLKIALGSLDMGRIESGRKRWGLAQAAMEEPFICQQRTAFSQTITTFSHSIHGCRYAPMLSREASPAQSGFSQRPGEAIFAGGCGSQAVRFRFGGTGGHGRPANPWGLRLQQGLSDRENL